MGDDGRIDVWIGAGLLVVLLSSEYAVGVSYNYCPLRVGLMHPRGSSARHRVMLDM